MHKREATNSPEGDHPESGDAGSVAPIKKRTEKFYDDLGSIVDAEPAIEKEGEVEKVISISEQ